MGGGLAGIAGGIRGDSCGVVGWLLIVGGRVLIGFLLYLEVGAMIVLAVCTDVTEDREDIGTVGGAMSSFLMSIPGSV